MDAFYASVEQLDHPEWRGKPLVVGGNENRGVVAAASYEARKFGVYSAMSSALAAKKCASLIFAKPRFERYKEILVWFRLNHWSNIKLSISSNNSSISNWS